MYNAYVLYALVLILKHWPVCYTKQYVNIPEQFSMYSDSLLNVYACIY